MNTQSRIFGGPKLYAILGIAAVALAQNPKGHPLLWWVAASVFFGVAVWRFVARPK